MNQAQAPDVSDRDEVRDVVDEVKDNVHWVDKGEAARELGVSLSTLDRMIRRGELEVAREGRRVYVKLPGPRYPSDRELLRQAMTKVQRLELMVDELVEEADQLERERGQAQAETEAASAENGRLQGLYRAERLARGRTRRLAGRLGWAVFVLTVLLVVGGVMAWVVARQ